jgi:hypothetical protein
MTKFRFRIRLSLVLAFILGFLIISVNANTLVRLEKAIINVDVKDTKKYSTALLLQAEIYNRTGIRLPISTNIKNKKATKIILTLTKDTKLPKGVNFKNYDESFVLWLNDEDKKNTVITIAGSDYRGILFGAGRLIQELYLSANYISIPQKLVISSSPSDKLRAQQIIKNSQGKDGFNDWSKPEVNQQFVNDMLIFGTNGFEPTQPELVDEYLEGLGIDLFVKLKCQDVIDLNTKTDDSIKSFFKKYSGIDHITSYGGDAAGAAQPQLFFPYLDRVIPLILKGNPGSKWWYSNQCLDDHAKDFDDYIFKFINEKQPTYLHGMVYGPWTKRGINEIRADLPPQYIIRHFPDICHPRWSQYPIPQWDRVFSIVWPRNQSIYMMPTMMLDIYKATRNNSVGNLPYNHTGSFNDLNKFVISAAGWNADADINSILTSYAKVFFAHSFIKLPKELESEKKMTKEEFLNKATSYVVKGLQLLEQNWTGQLKNNSSCEEALHYWTQIAECIGGPQKNRRVEMYLYKARIDAQIKRKYDFEMQLEKEAYKIIANANDNLPLTIQKVKSNFDRVDKEFQSKDEFQTELKAMGLSGKFGDIQDIVDNIYTSFNDRYWIIDQLQKAKSITDLLAIVNYEDPGDGGYYDDLGLEGKQPHLVRQKQWKEDPGFVYSPIEWVDNKSNSNRRHSQLTSILCRYDNPLIMQWNDLDKSAKYEIKVVYNGPFDIKLKCSTDDGLIIHDFIEKNNGIALTFQIPEVSTKDGTLQLNWVQDTTNIMRGVSLSEIWLIKK